MKIIHQNFKSGWDAESVLAIGFGISAGKSLDPRRLDCPTLAGVHLSVGYLFGQTHVWIGVEPRQQPKGSLKFLQLRKL